MTLASDITKESFTILFAKGEAFPRFPLVLIGVAP